MVDAVLDGAVSLARREHVSFGCEYRACVNEYAKLIVTSSAMIYSDFKDEIGLLSSALIRCNADPTCRIELPSGFARLIRLERHIEEIPQDRFELIPRERHSVANNSGSKGNK